MGAIEKIEYICKKLFLYYLEEQKNCTITKEVNLGCLFSTDNNSSNFTVFTLRYLYQVFTEPIFESKTFFFELIQRDNANGFGAGNVTALWNALDARLNGKNSECD